MTILKSAILVFFASFAIFIPQSTPITPDGLINPPTAHKQVSTIKSDIELLEPIKTQNVETPAPAPTPVVAYTGTHSDWMTQAGIPASEQSSAERLIHRESSWNANAYNASSGSCSLVQALPCSKIPGNWKDPVTALRWGNGYVKARYGSWHVALSHSLRNNWY